MEHFLQTFRALNDTMYSPLKSIKEQNDKFKVEFKIYLNFLHDIVEIIQSVGSNLPEDAAFQSLDLKLLFYMTQADWNYMTMTSLKNYYQFILDAKLPSLTSFDNLILNANKLF